MPNYTGARGLVSTEANGSYHFVDEVSDHPSTAGVILFTVTTLLRAADDQSTTKPTAQSIRVMSFNIRNSGEDDHGQRLPNRRDLYFQTIKNFSPDLIGFQEVLADQHDQILDRFKDYTFAGVARNDGKRKGEWALIGFRSARFEKLEDGNFWLSNIPMKPGSKSWDAALTRICSWVRLKDRLTGRELIYANTHWDHRGKIARRKAAVLIKQKLPTLSKSQPVILTGDFNSTEDDDWVRALLRAVDPTQVQLIDSYREVHPTRSKDEATYHAFAAHSKVRELIFILHSPELTSTSSEIDRSKSAQGRYPSDHFAMEAVLNWK